MTGSLPAPLRDFIARRVEAGGFASVSDYVRELIRRDQRDAELDRHDRALAHGLAELDGIPREAWQEFRDSLVRGEHGLVSARFAETAALMQAAIVLVRERLRRDFPDAAEADLDRRVAQWLHERCDGGQADGPGRPISAERLQRIRGE
jgi:Arc/MetJ-type ribon-helix-helix transcriptional regulator